MKYIYGIMETWKSIDIEGFTGLYEVSNIGDVRNVKTQRILKQSIQRNGYYTIALWNHGKVKRCLVHRLVGIAFLPKLDGYNVIDHIDRNRTNNNSQNLRWANYYINNQNSHNYVGTAIYLDFRDNRNTYQWRVNWYEYTKSSNRFSRRFCYEKKDEAFSLFLEKGGDSTRLNDF